MREVLEIIADNLKERGWNLGWVSAIDSEGRTIWIANAHRGDGRRYIVRADEKLTALRDWNRPFPDTEGCIVAASRNAQHFPIHA